jgi:hypothetical protein
MAAGNVCDVAQGRQSSSQMTSLPSPSSSIVLSKRPLNSTRQLNLHLLHNFLPTESTISNRWVIQDKFVQDEYGIVNDDLHHRVGGGAANRALFGEPSRVLDRVPC